MNTSVIHRTVELAKAICPTKREMRSSHVAFLIKSGKIVHVGWNKSRSHPINLDHPYHVNVSGIHAEVDVILKSGLEDLSKYEMVVIRIDRNDRVCNSMPCVGCRSVVRQFNVKRIWYSNANGIVIPMD